jgi:hypothetical protein
MDLNDIFSKEFKELQVEANKGFDELLASIKNMQDIPAITDLNICQKLEVAHFNIYINAIRVSNTAQKLSQLYHYVYLLNDGITKEMNEEDKTDEQ